MRSERLVRKGPRRRPGVQKGLGGVRIPGRGSSLQEWWQHWWGFLPFMNNEPKYWIDSKSNWSDLWIVLRWIFMQCMTDFSAALSVAGEYTVNGARCLRGGCRLNPDVNYWWGHNQLFQDFGSKHCCQPYCWRDFINLSKHKLKSCKIMPRFSFSPSCKHCNFRSDPNHFNLSI